jgi:hypothetical protein
MRRIFVSKRDEVTEDWRKLHNEKLHNLYSSPNINRMIKSMRIRWVEYVACMGRRGMYVILVGNPEGMDVCVCLFCVCVVLCVGSGLATG